MKTLTLTVMTLLTISLPGFAQSRGGFGGGVQGGISQQRPPQRQPQRPPQPTPPPRRPDDRRPDDRRPDDRRPDDRRPDDRRPDDNGRDICQLNYAGRSESTREYSMGACQQRVNEAVVRFCGQNPKASVNVTYRWNGQGETAFFPCQGWGEPAGGPACTIRYAGRTETTHEVAMGACQQRVNEAVVRYCATHQGQPLDVDYRWDGRGATAHFNCAR